MNIRRLTAKDKSLFPGATELLNRTQGRDLFAPTYLDERTASPTSYVVAALANDQVVGIGVSEIITNFDYYLPFDADIYANLQGLKVGSFSTMCILETLQGQGIGQKLSRLRLEWLTAQECDVILGVSWISGLAHTSNRVFEKMGFHAVGRVDDFYRESSIAKPFLCPGCGEPPCDCGAILYRKDL